MTATAILANVATKTCTKCGETKPATDFYKHRSYKDGLANYCKSCDRDLHRKRNLSPQKIAALDRYESLKKSGQKECNCCHEVKPHSEFYFRTNRNEFYSRCMVCERSHKANKWNSYSEEKKKALSKQHYAKTGDKQKENKKAAYWADPEAASERNRINRERYREAILATQKAWYLANQDAQRIKSKAHYEANKQSYIDGNRRRTNQRVKTDPVFALSRRIRSLIYIRIYSGGYTKRSKSQEILGCTWPEFKQHIECQFTLGMSWDRLGEIHLDHIIPLATARNEDDVIRLNHFTNIRPLWAKDNLSKGAKLSWQP